MRISDWSSDVCSSDLALLPLAGEGGAKRRMRGASAASCFATNIKSFRAVTARATFLCLCHYCPVKVHNQSRKRLFYIVIRSIFPCHRFQRRSEEHTSELQSLMRISYAVFCLKKKNKHHN